MPEDRYGVLIFEGYGKGVYSFWGYSLSYNAMIKGMPEMGIKPLYGIDDVVTGDLDKVADAASKAVKRIGAGESFDVLKELNAARSGWKELSKN